MTPPGDDQTIRCRLRPRNPITVERLPLLAEFYRIGWKRPQRRAIRRLIGKPSGKLFRLLSRLGMRGTGVARLAGPEGSREIRFDGRNTQYSGIYLPQHMPVYESETSALIDRLVQDDGVFYDVGANWGWYSVLVASRPGFAGQVHTFEPVPASYADLVSVVSQSGLERLIHCHDYALGRVDGEVAMGLPDGVQSGLAQVVEHGDIRVRIARLDSLDLPPPQVIKLDVEDHEIEVLQGAEGTLASARPFLTFESHRYEDRPEMTMTPLRFLASRGFRLYCPGWVGRDPDELLVGGQPPEMPEATLALAPLLPAHRFLLTGHLNLFAVPEERVGELRRILGAI